VLKVLAMDDTGLDTHQRQQLLHLARSVILRRLQGLGEMQLEDRDYHPHLQRQAASFVTLNRDGRLRGCIGNLSPSRPLFVDVAHNAAAAAFRDPRFEPLALEEYAELELHISVLGEPRQLDVQSREELVQQLRPGLDGVILQQGSHRATYLPSVWAQLPDPEQFITELRRKAGLPRAGWSEETKVSIYTTCEFT
jgi:AmmeMemoRadiSam system protein A